MPTNEIQNILALKKEDDIIQSFKRKIPTPPKWSTLELQYYAKHHDIMNEATYQDVSVTADGKVVRVPLTLEQEATNRLTGLTFGLAVTRSYDAQNETQQRAQAIIERIYKKNRINALNLKRGKFYFAACEMASLWYLSPSKPHYDYGEKCEYKLRHRTYTPMEGDSIYPLFNEDQDLIALSFEYNYYNGLETRRFFDTFTDNVHIRWEFKGDTADKKWVRLFEKKHEVGKIPGVYAWAKEPCWRESSRLRAEQERTYSDNGNYIRDNSTPVLAIFADGKISFGEEDNRRFRKIVKYPANGRMEYVTWQQSPEAVKMQLEGLRREFYTSLQIPDISFENMKSLPISGEAMKRVFIDAQLRVKQESGALQAFLDREANVIKAFAPLMFPELERAFNELTIENTIHPYTIDDEKDRIDRYTSATGGKAIMSQREAIERSGLSRNPSQTLEEIRADEAHDVFGGYE